MIRLPALVLHDLGDEGGGAPWATALAGAGWAGPVAAPDLPGHRGSPPPRGRQLRRAATASWSPCTPSARPTRSPSRACWSASARTATRPSCSLSPAAAAALVLVDGLGGPWPPATEAVAGHRRWLRAIAADDAADHAAAGGRGARSPAAPRRAAVDQPRVARSAAGELAVPVLVLETPSSTTPRAVRDDLLGRLGDGSLVELADRRPATVATAIVAWAEALG